MPQTPPLTGQNSSSYNKNLFQSQDEGYPGLYYHDNTLVSGSLEALIHHLVPTVDYYPDVSEGRGGGFTDAPFNLLLCSFFPFA